MDEATTTGGRIMATEAQNIMQAFYASNKRAEIKEEEREFKKGSLGYMGGLPGALYDIAGGMEAINMFSELKEGVTELFDRRSLGEKIADETILANNAVSEAKTILKAAGYDYDADSSVADISSAMFKDMGFITTNLFGGEFTNKYNKHVAGTSLVSKTPQGNTINYTVATKNQPKPWNMGGGKMNLTR